MKTLRPILASLTGLLSTMSTALAQKDSTAVESRNGLVVSVSAPASDIGAAILARGGNAVDAAVATAFALAVTHPSAGNIGGGGFMIVRLPDGTATTIDYRERAPGKSTPTMYLGADGKIDRSLTAAGWLAPGVPGTVRGLELAHRKFGKLPWADVVKPAADLATDGWALSRALARSINGQLRMDSAGRPGKMRRFPTSVAAYGKAGGGEWVAGDRIQLADLGRSLREIATSGPDAFYRGWIADSIDAQMARNGGIISRADLRDYKAVERAPVRGTFLGNEIISMGPPSSGGIVMVETLNLMERMGVANLAPGSAEYLHRRIEAARRAYLDRARFLGDPDFVKVPVERLTSARYADSLAKTISPPGSQLSRTGRRHRGADAGVGGDDPFLGRRRPGDGGVQHVHAGSRLWVGRRRGWNGDSPQQRNGRLQQEARRDQHHGRHRHAGQRHRPGEADAQLDGAGDRHARRQAAPGDRFARGAHHSEHGARRHPGRDAVQARRSLGG
jgi:gamma-glutamyltranspeptidase/glutathione hydrolase